MADTELMSTSSDGLMHRSSIDVDELNSQQQPPSQQHDHSAAAATGDEEENIRRMQSSSSLMSATATDENVSQYSFSSSVPTHQKLVVRSEVRGVMSDAISARVVEQRSSQHTEQQQQQQVVPTNNNADIQEVQPCVDVGDSGVVNHGAEPPVASDETVIADVHNNPMTATLLAPESAVPLSTLHHNETSDASFIKPEQSHASHDDDDGQHSDHLLVTSSLLIPTFSGTTTGPTPRKLTATVSISTPPSGSFGQHLGAAVISPTATRHAARLPPIDATEDALHATDEVAVRRRIEQLSTDLTNRLSSHTPSRNTTFSTIGSFGSHTNRSSQGAPGSSSSVIPSIGAPLPSVASGVDRRKMRDGLIAMSTEARNEDVRTILCKREIKLAEVLDEQLVLQKKLDTLTSDVNTLADQKLSLEHLRRDHHAEMIRLRSDVSILNKELNGLKWEEGRLHQEITDLTNSLQRFRHKRSNEEIKRLQELNSVSYELSSIEKAIESETSSYKEEWQRLRRELRTIQEEIVSFSPQEWLAAAVAAGMKKKIAVAEFGGDQQKAHQYATATLAAAGRRKTVATIESDRSALDAFLQGPQ
ncbi:Hypothetical protein, putative [Bodo saltans]|uniref:Uncharacterized protein n=1 Tax=Bodo saltans TaxID=75058 RepID=A0A0S4JGE2_BODSA|nr:Hypothetical protein, putative [Bodo saltans]|eukprot:CUG88503.1 Hypothetical protein, putative [Bodo saltans]